MSASKETQNPSGQDNAISEILQKTIKETVLDCLHIFAEGGMISRGAGDSQVQNEEPEDEMEENNEEEDDELLPERDRSRERGRPWAKRSGRGGCRARGKDREWDQGKRSRTANRYDGKISDRNSNTRRSRSWQGGRKSTWQSRGYWHQRGTNNGWGVRKNVARGNQWRGRGGNWSGGRNRNRSGCSRGVYLHLY